MDSAAAQLDAARPATPRRGAGKWIVLLIAAYIALAHGWDLSHGFVDWDDPIMLSGNPLLNPPTSESLKIIWLHGVDGLYTPLAYTVWAAVAGLTPRTAAGALQPIYFHGLNIILHTLTVLVAFAFLRRWLRASAPMATRPGEWAAAFGALLFAVHPLVVEPVAWIAGMNNLLAGFFVIATAFFYVRSLDPADHRRGRCYAIAIITLILAMLAKPTAVATPLVLLVLDWQLSRGKWQQTLLRILPFAVLTIPFVVIGRAVQPAANVVALPLFSRLIVAADAVGFYASKLAWPASLAMDYGRTPQHVLDASGSIGNWIALAVVIAIIAATHRRWPAIAAAVLVFLAALSPVLGLVPFAYQLYSTVADRYAYVAMLGPAMLIAALLTRFRSPALANAIGLLTLLCLFRSAMQSAVWKDSIALGTHAVAVNPDSLGAHGMLGHAYAVQGDLAKAEVEDREALRVSPDDADANFNLACLLMTRDPQDAIAHFAAAANAGFADPVLYRNSGIAWLKLNEPRRALDCFEIAHRNGLPNDGLTLEQTAIAWQSLGDVDRAADAYVAAARFAPRSVSITLRCAQALFAAHRYAEADAAAQQTLNLDPASTDASNLRRQIEAVRP